MAAFNCSLLQAAFQLLRLWVTGFSYFDGLTLVTPAGKVPIIGKAAALDRFDGLDETDVFTLQENAFTVRFVDDGKTGSVGVEPRISLNELFLRQTQKVGDVAGFSSGDANVARPAAAIATALAKVLHLGFVKL